MNAACGFRRAAASYEREPLKGKVAEAFAMCFVDMCAAVDRGWWGGCG